jgi:Tfp pilus assembly protein PilV
MTRATTIRGVALLEVLIAIAVLAVSGLGVAAAQLASAREARQAAWRADALLAADAYAETARSGGVEAAGEAPFAWVDALADLTEPRPGIRVVTLWRARGAVAGGAAGRCDHAALPGAPRECVALAFATAGGTR